MAVHGIDALGVPFEGRDGTPSRDIGFLEGLIQRTRVDLLGEDLKRGNAIGVRRQGEGGADLALEGPAANGVVVRGAPEVAVGEAEAGDTRSVPLERAQRLRLAEALPCAGSATTA